MLLIRKDEMYFKSLEVNSWQQFENINIDFQNKLTILTGANGSGKTTLLKQGGRLAPLTHIVPVIPISHIKVSNGMGTK